MLRDLLRAEPPNPVAEEAAIETLGRIGSAAAIHELCALLGTDSTTDQPMGRRADFHLVDALVLTHSPSAIDPLLGVLRSLEPRLSIDNRRDSPSSPDDGDEAAALSEHFEVARRIVGALVALGAEAELGGFARGASATGDDGRRCLAAMVVALLDRVAPTAETLLVDAARDPVADTRLVAIQALGQHETPPRRAALVRACIHDHDDRVRAAAAAALVPTTGTRASTSSSATLVTVTRPWGYGRRKPSV